MKSEIFVNGQSHLFSTPLPLKELLKELKIDSPSIAVALNHEIVPRSLFETRIIQAGDALEVIRAVAGG